MSTRSHRSSSFPHPRPPNQSRTRSTRSGSRLQPAVGRDDSYSFALRVAYLHYLLQPRSKRKQYVNSPKSQPARPQSGIGQLVAEFAPGNTGSLKLPHGFRNPLEKRMEGVLRGSEKLPGYSDPAVKRCFGEAYTAFTEKSFQKTIDKERKLESLVLIFYSSAVKVAQKGQSQGSDAWKLLPDRHTALFVRLVATILRDMGHDRDRSELMSRLRSLENKLLTNDQDLVQDGGGTTVEVVVPLSYQVKDMPLVLTVARVFGVAPRQAQADVDSNSELWTEEAALRDLKSYQNRLNSNSRGALGSQDFDVDEAFQDWKKSEAQHLSHMIHDILIAKPELAKTSSSGLDISAMAGRPRSTYGEEQAYGDLSRVIMNDDYSTMSMDQSLSLGALSLDQSSSTIRSVDEPNYVFIPHDPRGFYKAVLHYVMTYDLAQAAQADSSAPFQPISQQSTELLVELCVRWRLPQSSRLTSFVEVVGRKFCDGELDGENLDQALELVKGTQPELKKPPHIQHHASGLSTLSPTHWTMADFVAYQQTLASLHDALIRDLYALMVQCYEHKAPSVGVVMYNLENHILSDSAFSQSPEEAAEFSNSLAEGLTRHAEKVYRGFIDQHLPSEPEEWNFLHVVNLGKAVVKLCERTKKRYNKNPVVMGANPMFILVETMFPSFEEDARAIVQRILQVAEAAGQPVHTQDGFDLYRELLAIRDLHVAVLPKRPFAFNVEELLVSFVWHYIEDSDQKLLSRIEEAIKFDPFQVRIQDPDQVLTDSDKHSSSVMDVFMLFNTTIKHIVDLDWKNEYHHAKFMTALSKSFGAGISRYCDILEQKFSKEMDRPTEQEAAAASRTTQERFLKYAKDAWNTKEKAEPFQFYAESFVKLNNVEYAMQQMDRLEATMNVDACARVIERAEGLKKQQRRPNNYVFTVKIVEAEDLKACDAGGTSDPYVILGDEFRKRLYKSRIIYRTLNPRWDESIDIAAQGAVNLVVTIWDWDAFGEHDCVGRTSLKLDPIHFSDYLPREFWLDLDTQGRVLLRVSMEGERDDIQFYFGKTFRCLKRTERDMVRKVTEKLSTQINETLSRDTLRSLVKTGGIIGNSVANLWKKGPAAAPLPGPTDAEIEQALQPLCDYFFDNFGIMNQTLTRATMEAVMARLWKEVLMAMEALVVPPLSEKPSSQKPLGQKELDIVYAWLNQLFEFFNARDQSGEVLGVKADVLKSPKWHELVSLNFFYFDETEVLIRESERIAAGAAQRTQQALMQSGGNRLSLPPGSLLGPASGSMSASASSSFAAVPFASMGTIRRGKSVMLSRNLGTMRRVKEEKRREAQAEPNDDMILRILRMRPEAAGFLKERHRQKERQAAAAAAAMIVKKSVSQGWNSLGGGGTGGRAPYGRNSMVRR